MQTSLNQLEPTFGLDPSMNSMLTQPSKSLLTSLLLSTAFIQIACEPTLAGDGMPPTIAPIASQTVFVDHPVLFKFYIHDVDTATNNLKLSFASSNPALFPTENAVFYYFLYDSDGPHWYMTLVPTFGGTGTATNTLTVSDGTNTTSANFVVTINPPPPGAARFANTSAITIPEVGASTPNPSSINVAGMSGTITNLTLTLNKFHHQYPDDIQMLLVGPTGQGVVIWSGCGGSYLVNVTVTLCDAAPFALPDQYEIWSEQFRPTNFGLTNVFPAPAPAGPYGTDLAAFKGLPPNGTWSLYVYDKEAPDHGGIDGGWSLMIATSNGYTYTPPLRILSLTGGGTTNATITWSAVSNTTYQAQYQSPQTSTNWFALAPNVTATGTTASVTDRSGDQGPRFYRVRIVP